MQNDLKKVVAYSTCSQLGYMVFACGLSSYSTSVFHLFNHAFFKALLFLGAGSIIHALLDEQDMRKMGGLAKVLPLTYISVLVGSLALMGVAPLAGFYSKDYVLESAYGMFEVHGAFAYWLGVLSVLFTAYYSIRLLLLVFVTGYRGSKYAAGLLKESSLGILVPLVVLSVISLLVGYLFRDMFIGLGTPFWGGSISEVRIHAIGVQSEFSLGMMKMIPLVFTVAGGTISFLLYSSSWGRRGLVPSTRVGYLVWVLLSNKWFFDTLYNEWICKNVLFLGYRVTYKMLDQGFLEFLGSVGLLHLVRRVSTTIGSVQSGYLYHMSLSIVVGFFVLCLLDIVPHGITWYILAVQIPFGVLLLL